MNHISWFDNYKRVSLLGKLVLQSPVWLRRQLQEPDPVWLHDWDITKSQYESAIYDALRIV